MKEKKLSIIIPTYNSSYTICKCVKSIIDQTERKSVEIIVVDDGSTDDTQKKLEQYIKTGDITYYLKENGGVSSARNYGISKSTAHYISFLDSDDYIDNNYVKKMVDRISKSNANLCYCGYNSFSNESTIKNRTRFYNKDILYNYYLGKLKLQTACFVIDKKILIENNINFDENISWGEDIDFFTRVIKISRNITYVKEYLVYYDMSPKNSKLSSSDINKVRIDKNNCMKLLSYGLSKKEKKAIINYRLPALIIYRIYSNEYNKNIKNVYEEYSEDVKKMRLINGIRSVKLLIYYIFFRIKNNIRKR